MIRATRIVLATLIVCVLTSHFATGNEASAHTGYFRNTGNNLNLREGPGGDYAVIGKVNNWDVVKAFGHKGNWLKLRVLRTGQVGWAWLWNFDPSSYVPPPPPPPPSEPSLQLCFWNYWGQTMCAPYWIAKAVYDAARYWGASYWALMSVAACESNFNPYAYNPASGVTGLFQFMPSTFYGFGGTGDIWSVYNQAWLAAKMFSQGLAFHWHCAQLMGIA